MSLFESMNLVDGIGIKKPTGITRSGGAGMEAFKNFFDPGSGSLIEERAAGAGQAFSNFINFNNYRNISTELMKKLDKDTQKKDIAEISNGKVRRVSLLEGYNSPMSLYRGKGSDLSLTVPPFELRVCSGYPQNNLEFQRDYTGKPWLMGGPVPFVVMLRNNLPRIVNPESGSELDSACP